MRRANGSGSARRSDGALMHTIYLDADACPVKEETYRVARRYSVGVVVVANAALYVPAEPLVRLLVVSGRGFNAADDQIVELAGAGDIVVTADVPLAARCVKKAAIVLDPKGRTFTPQSVGVQLGMRDLSETLRQMGALTGGPAPMGPKDRSRFLAKLDEAVNRVRRTHPEEARRPHA